jgi:hypothetical protein
MYHQVPSPKTLSVFSELLTMHFMTSLCIRLSHSLKLPNDTLLSYLNMFQHHAYNLNTLKGES